MAPIEAIIFDIGRVIIDFDHLRAAQQLGAISGLSAPHIWDIFYKSGIATRYERGLLSTEQMMSYLHKEAVRQNFTREEFIYAAGDIFKPKVDTINLIYELKDAGYPLYLLSNTCEAHWQVFSQRYPVFQECFQGHTLSFEVKAMKPEARIFDAAITKAAKLPGACFYTDDVRDFVTAARTQGMHAVLFKGAAQLRQQLLSAGVSL